MDSFAEREFMDNIDQHCRYLTTNPMFNKIYWNSKQSSCLTVLQNENANGNSLLRNSQGREISSYLKGHASFENKESNKSVDSLTS